MVLYEDICYAATDPSSRSNSRILKWSKKVDIWRLRGVYAWRLSNFRLLVDRVYKVSSLIRRILSRKLCVCQISQIKTLGARQNIRRHRVFGNNSIIFLGLIISIECLLNSVLFLMRLYKQTFPRLLFSLDPPLIRSNGKHLIA